jgi:hypothetical protein
MRRLDERILAMGSPRKPPEPKLFANDFWTRPKPSTQKDRTPDSVYAAVGRALSTWEAMEEELAFLCGVLANVTDNIAFRRMFGTVDSSGVRRKLILSAGEVYFWPYDRDGATLAKLKKLIRAVSEASSLRDDIAHGKVAGFGRATKAGDIVGWYLIPSTYNKDRNKAFTPDQIIDQDSDEFPFNFLPGNYRYTSVNIDDIISKFKALTKSIIEQRILFIDWKKTAVSSSEATGS